jgi:hypothetical protein
MVRVLVPRSRPTERRYILKVILEEFLGLEHRVEEAEGDATRILMDGDAAERSVVVLDELLSLEKDQWLAPSSLPRLPLRSYVPPPTLGFASDYPVPTMFGGKPTKARGSLTIDFDLFGSAFFLLTRYEEFVLEERDKFGRFQAKDSTLWKAGALNRPVVDDYTEILRRAIEASWPGTAFKRREFRIIPTHDVDAPYEYLFVPAWKALRRAAARRSVSGAGDYLSKWRKVRGGDDRADPNFDALIRIMEMSERAGLQSRFYFLAGRTDARFDGDYQIEHPRMRKLLRMIHERGHTIGLHPSYGTLGKVDLLKDELNRLQRVCDEERIAQDEWSVRSHYLRWESRHSFRDFEAVGFDFDSTLMFAERVGFRCGTCHEFSAFDIASGVALALREQPLIAMELSLLGAMTENLSHTAAAKSLVDLKRRCQVAQGQYIFLWHNSRFNCEADWEVYREQLTAS